VGFRWDFYERFSAGAWPILLEPWPLNTGRNLRDIQRISRAGWPHSQQPRRSWIYDPKVSDRAMLRLLEERKNAGMEEADETPEKGVGESAGAGIQDACPDAPA
jgi:hypothetical protein